MTHPSAEETRIRQGLEALGLTPDLVADSLREMGIRGRRGSCMACPVARWALMQGLHSPSLDTLTLTWWDRMEEKRYETTLPLPVTLFIERFDDPSGPYADLVEVRP